MVLAGFRFDPQIGTQEGRSQLGDQLFDGVAFIAPLLPSRVAVQAAGVFGPVGQLVGERSGVAFGVAKGLKRGHPHIVGFVRVVGSIASRTNVGPSRGKEGLGTLDAGNRFLGLLTQLIEVSGQPLALLGIEDGVFLEERNLLLDLLAVVALLLLLEGAGIDDRRAFLALLDVRTEFLRLPTVASR